MDSKALCPGCIFKQKELERGRNKQVRNRRNVMFGGSEFDVLVQKLDFQTAFKKVFNYKRVPSINDTTKNTFYIHTGEPTEVVTLIDGEKETKNKCNPGDFVITGPKGEKYVIAPNKLPNNYNIIENVLVTRQQPRLVAYVSKKLLKALRLADEIQFTASWGEAMILKCGDYLVKEGEGMYYRIEGDVFKKTYTFGSK